MLQNLLFSFVAGQEIQLQIARGTEIEQYVQDLVRLSDTIYCLYPYLYDGSQSDEEFYRRLYQRNPNARAIMVLDDGKAVGYVVGALLKDIPIGHQVLLDHGYSVDSLFLIGEIVLLEPYRGKHLGKQIVETMERLAKEEIGCEGICLTQIDEDFVPAPKPKDYCPPDGFWQKLGYQPYKNLHFQIEWKHVNEMEQTSHRLFYWVKPLT